MSNIRAQHFSFLAAISELYLIMFFVINDDWINDKNPR